MAENPSLEAVKGPLAGRRFEVGPGGLRLGRSSTCDIHVPDEELSRNHCLFEAAGPTGLRVTDLAMDLSIIAAVLSSNVDTPIDAGWCMAGEVGLSGEVRPVSRIEQRIAEAEKLGFTDMILPKYNLQGIDPKKYHIALHPVRKVEEALRALFG